MELNRRKKTGETAVDTSRRRALKKILLGGGVAVGASVLPGKWMKPVIDAGLLPAHAQMSGVTPVQFTYYIDHGPGWNGIGPRAARIVVGGTAPTVSALVAPGTANIYAINRNGDLYIELLGLPVDGTPSNGFTTIPGSCYEGSSNAPGASWRLNGYTSGAPNAVLESLGGEESWQVTVPLGDGVLPATCSDPGSQPPFPQPIPDRSR